MRIRILEDTAGEMRHHQQGDVLDLPDRQAMELLRRGVAEGMEPETATISPPRCEEVRRERKTRPERKRKR